MSLIPSTPAEVSLFVAGAAFAAKLTIDGADKILSMMKKYSERDGKAQGVSGSAKASEFSLSRCSGHEGMVVAQAETRQILISIQGSIDKIDRRLEQNLEEIYLRLRTVESKIK